MCVLVVGKTRCDVCLNNIDAKTSILFSNIRTLCLLIPLFFAHSKETTVGSSSYEPFFKRFRKTQRIKLLSPPSENQTKKYIVQHRIYRGYNCSAGNFPFLVAILQNFLEKSRERICGGSLITKKLVLTAAHCAKEKIFAGILMDTPHQLVVPVDSYYVHPQYDFVEFKNNVAVLILAESLTLEGLRMVKLPSIRSVQDITATCRQNAFVMGWGKTETLAAATSLQCVSLPIIHMSKCLEIYGDLVLGIEEQVFCTLSTKGKDACTGDSGGPVLCRDTQIGIVSWGGECGSIDSPGVNARTDYYLSFIHQVVRQESRRGGRHEHSNRGHYIFVSVIIRLWFFPFLVIVILT